MTLHIYRAREQRATRYTVDLDGKLLTICNRRRRLFHCHKCKRLRWATNMSAHVYYDGVYYSCRAGKGCKA